MRTINAGVTLTALSLLCLLLCGGCARFIRSWEWAQPQDYGPIVNCMPWDSDMLRGYPANQPRYPRN